jgi:hypothetical protein
MRRALAIALVLLFVMVAPVAAAAPNDTVAGATAVSVGSHVTQDTTGADTTDPAETALNTNCGAPKVEHGVWFTIAGSDQFVAFDVTDSDYAAGLMLFNGTPTADGLITCGPGQIVEFLATGQTYNVLAFGDGESTATSGSLVLDVHEGIAPPDLTVTINSSGTVNKQGVARISGTVSCTSSDGSGIILDIFGDVRQKVGRVIISGFFDTFLDAPCDGSTIPWEAFVQADNGLFAGGKAVTVAIGTGCTDFCSDSFAQATVQLRKNGK